MSGPSSEFIAALHDAKRARKAYRDQVKQAMRNKIEEKIMPLFQGVCNTVYIKDSDFPYVTVRAALFKELSDEYCNIVTNAGFECCQTTSSLDIITPSGFDASDEQPAANVEQSVANVEQTAASDEQTAASDEQPAASDEQPAANDEQSAANDE